MLEGFSGGFERLVGEGQKRVSVAFGEGGIDRPQRRDAFTSGRRLPGVVFSGGPSESPLGLHPIHRA